MKENTTFPQTPSKVSLAGEIIGLTNPRPNTRDGFEAGIITKEGRSKNKPFARANFRLKTSPENIVDVEIFATEPEFVYAYNRSTKITKKLTYQNRNAALPDGYVRLLSDYETALSLQDYADGDQIRINGELDYSTFENKDGKTIQKVAIRIRRVSDLNNPIDFESEKFAEQNYFIQGLIVDKTYALDDKFLLDCYIIKYGEILFPTTFEVEANIASNMKKLPFGTYLEAEGIINNRVIVTEVTEDTGWGKSKAKVIRNYDKSFIIYAVDPDTIDEKRYTRREIDKQLEQQTERSVEQNKDFNPQVKSPKTTHFEEDYDVYKQDIVTQQSNDIEDIFV